MRCPAAALSSTFPLPPGLWLQHSMAQTNGLPCVICSTGLSKADEAVLEAASAKTPIFRSANMSVGVNVLIELARQATKLSGRRV